MSNIDTINVGGLDYSVEDSVARETATSAVSVTAYVENGSTASRAYAVLGTPVNWKGSLYYTIATIAEGATLTAGTNLTAATNIGQMLTNIKTYVGQDSMLHFTDATGADSVLPFNPNKNYRITITIGGRGSHDGGSPYQYVTSQWVYEYRDGTLTKISGSSIGYSTGGSNTGWYATIDSVSIVEIE